ncbi:MAG: hypothetical protein ACI8QZ_003558 [Chlamydiales bacterium]
MAHFVVYTTLKRKRTAVLDLVSSSLDIGARSTCALTVQDPVVADRHCQVDFDAQQGVYTLRDRGSTTGTYLNGVRIEGRAPLSSGDSIVLGTMRMGVTVQADEDGPALHLELQEKAFQFQKAEFVRKTGAWIHGDRERWVESEVTFGRFPTLRKATWIAILIAVLSPLLLLSPRLRAKTFQPGPLASVHAALFDGSPIARADHASIAGAGCQACHDPFNGIPISSCYACHESTRASHPFQDLGELAADSTNSCLMCHTEHEGGQPGVSEQVALSGPWSEHVATVTTRAGSLVPEGGAALCEQCHSGQEFDDARVQRLRAAALEAQGPRAPGRTVNVPYDSFNHASHVGAAIDCKTCHLPAGAPDTETAVGRAFEPMGFEGCMGCHGDPDSDLPPRVAQMTGRAWSARPPTFPLAWHGASDDPSHCQVCHTEAYASEMRTVSRAEFQYLSSDGQPMPTETDDPRLLFAYSIRSHTTEFDSALAGLETPPNHPDDNCATCHVNGDWVTAGEAREARFYHSLHLTEHHTSADAKRLGRDPAGRQELAQAAQACDECHGLIGASNALSEPFYRAEQHSCIACHRSDPSDEGSVPRLIDGPARMQQNAPSTRVAFPHDAHMGSDDPSLAAGCYACHSFERSELAFRDPVVTPESVRDCTMCHSADHANVAGGSCSQCHLAGDPVFKGRVTDASWSVKKVWPAANTFDHFSSGHLQAVEADCSECHMAVEGALTIGEMRLPTEDDEACRKCHIEERGRFHWR